MGFSALAIAQRVEAKHKEIQNIMDKTTKELMDKEKLIEIYKGDLKHYESTTDEAKANYDSVLKNTNEAIAMARKAEEVYEMYAEFNTSDREKEMFEEIVQSRFESDRKDDEIKTLRYKLNQAYGFHEAIHTWRYQYAREILPEHWRKSSADDGRKGKIITNRGQKSIRKSINAPNLLDVLEI